MSDHSHACACNPCPEVEIGNEFDWCALCKGRLPPSLVSRAPKPTPKCVPPQTTPPVLVPGATVRHRHKHKDHDEWRGLLVSIVTTESMFGTSREYMVRWIKPCGDPSDGLSRCAADELEACG